MNQIEIDSLMTRLAELYPQWEATEQESRAWSAMLSREDPTAAKRAIQEMWEGSRFSRPTPGSFKKIIPAYQPRRQDQEQKDPETDVFVMCMAMEPLQEGEQRKAAFIPNRNLIGRIVPVYVGPLGREPRRDVLLAAAEKLRAGHADTYGGEWTVFQGRTYPEMTELRNRVRHDAGLKSCAQNSERT